MRVSDSFRTFALERLSGIEELSPRPMFGGIGVYAGDLFFGILAADVLYFKVDDTTRRDYEKAGSRPFRPYADRPMTMSYFDVPVGVLEDADTLATWARRSIEVARKARPRAGKALRLRSGQTGRAERAGRAGKARR